MRFATNVRATLSLLAKPDGAWKIFSVVDTRRREDCAPAPAQTR